MTAFPPRVLLYLTCLGEFTGEASPPTGTGLGRKRTAMRTGAKRGLFSHIGNYPALYFMALPGLVFFLLIRIVPVAGSMIAWQDFGIFRGLFRSPWVGWQNFKEMFAYYDFYRIFSNTLLIGLYRIVFGFPVPIILAILLNEVRAKWFRGLSQSLLVFPYFLSWVVVGQLFSSILNPSSGIVNAALHSLFGIEPIFFLGKDSYFHGIVTFTHIWKFSGYESIVYLAAMTTIDPQLYEAAEVDGASRWAKILHITLPSIAPVIVIMGLLSIGNFLEIGFDQIYNLMNPLVQSKGDIFDTYIYRVGLVNGRYSLTTAIGIFKSVIGFTLLLGGNALAQRFLGRGFFK
ncbi:MAG: ABC transporter permease subunit [Spirochaetota bacterium]